MLIWQRINAPCHCRLKDLNERCPAELKAYYECMDYYR